MPSIDTELLITLIKTWQIPRHIMTGGYNSALAEDTEFQSFIHRTGTGIWFKHLKSFIITSDTRHKLYSYNNPVLGNSMLSVLPRTDRAIAKSIWGTSEVNVHPIKFRILKSRDALNNIDVLTSSELFVYMHDIFESLTVTKTDSDEMIIVIDDISDCIKFKLMFGEK